LNLPASGGNHLSSAVRLWFVLQVTSPEVV
jgi:hypothetical protein